MNMFAKVVIFSIFLKLYLPKLLPYGPASLNPDRASYSLPDLGVHTLGGQNGNLKKIYERIPENGKALLDGPETIILDDDSNIYALIAKLGILVSITNLVSSPKDENILYADVTELASFVGSPLGGKFVPGTKILYIADTLLGLCRIDLAKKNPKVELVASKVKLSDGSESPILYADDVDIGKSGMVYFSDASNILCDRKPDLSYDVMHAYKLDYFRGVKSGRLLRYDPTIDKVDVLADGIWFANGIAVDKANEEFIMIAETSMTRTLKYNLKGAKKGTLEVMNDGLVGLPDGVDCTELGDKCYIAIPTSIPPVLQIFYSRYMPKILEAALKTLLMMLPKSLSPPPQSYGAVVEIKMTSESSTLGRLFQDPYGVDIMLITGVTEKGGNLYLGSLHNSFIGVLDLNAN